MEITKIKLTEAIETAALFLEDPTNEEREKSFNALEGRLMVKSYLTMREKLEAIREVIQAVGKAEETVISFTEAEEVTITFCGLLRYTNIEIESPKLVNSKFYDVLWASGLGDYIMQFCLADFRRLQAMVQQSLSFEHITQMLHTVENINVDQLDRFNEDLHELVDRIDPNTVHDITEIIRSQDAIVAGIQDAVDKAVEEEFREKDASDAEEEKES